MAVYHSYNNDNIISLNLFFILIFFIGLMGVTWKRSHFLITLFSIEIMYIGIICLSASVSITSHVIAAQSYALIFLIVAACESAIGLGILIVLYNYGNSLSFSDYEELKG